MNESSTTLSHGASNQAPAIQEAAVSLNGIRAMTEKNEENSSKSHLHSESSLEVAGRSKKAVDATA